MTEDVKVSFLLRPRIWFLFVALACFGMVSYALYVQHVDFLDPCPLCVFQRVAFIGIGAVALVAALHGPGPAGRWVYGALVITGGIVGMGIAGRHLWLQNLPADQVPDCGMGLNYMLETMPFTEVLSEVFYGSGECAEVIWQFLGLSMPGWTFIWYALFTIGTIGVLMRNRHERTRAPR
jgi:disulfide bond formation protein DsbB